MMVTTTTMTTPRLRCPPTADQRAVRSLSSRGVQPHGAPDMRSTANAPHRHHRQQVCLTATAVDGLLAVGVGGNLGCVLCGGWGWLSDAGTSVTGANGDGQAEPVDNVSWLDVVLLLSLCLVALASTVLMVVTRSVWTMLPLALVTSLFVVLRAPRLV